MIRRAPQLHRHAAAFLAAGALACGARVPEPPAPVPAPAETVVDEDALRAILDAEPVRVAPALPPVLEHHPAAVPEGTALLLTVMPVERSAPIAEVTGKTADRTLAFARADGGGFWTVAPAPLGATALTVELIVRYVGSVERSERIEIPVARRKFRSETLRVASRFTNPSARALARIRDERDLVAETVRRITPVAVWNEPFAKPRDDVATSFFGTRRMFNGQVRSRHLGYDLRGSTGDPVYASNRGRVALARDLYYSGNSVYLDHGLGLYTAYFHMSEILVQEGAWVEKGQLIGKVGATGRVTGPHVHWSVSFQGIPLDPEALLDLRPPPVPAAAAADPASLP